MSLARKHKARVQQEKVEQVETEFKPVLTNTAVAIKQTMGALPEALQKLKDGFDGDRQTLKLLSGNEHREPFKLELIEKYRPLCEYFMQHYDDWAHLDCLFWWLLWRSDVDEFADIQGELYQAVQRGLTTPTKGFERDWQTFYSDFVYLHCDEKIKADESWDATSLSQLVDDIANGDIIINGPLKAKVYAVYGKVSMNAGNTEIAVKAFKTALNLNENVGVKKLLTQCKQLLAPAETETSELGKENE